MTKDNTVLSSTELNAARVLIAFYFLAVAAGFTDGVSLAPVFESFLDKSIAGGVSQAVLFTMGFLVLVGTFLRAVALGMAGFLLASYVLVAAKTGDWQPPDTIWRDIALIGALILTYAQREGFFSRRPAPVGKRAKKMVDETGGLSKAEQAALLAHVPGIEVKGLYAKSKKPRPVLQDVFRETKTPG
jgi:uncharacterized membrane protein YphA (DoxX/SURF4 family)